jgi:hypothetical protein
MLARVKQEYLAGPVMAFSGREYVRSEWREVPAGFEEQAKSHPLLDTQPSTKEIRAGSSQKPGLGTPAPETQEPAVTAVTEESQAAEPAAEATPAEESPAAEPAEEEPKTSRGRRRRTGAED